MSDWIEKHGGVIFVMLAFIVGLFGGLTLRLENLPPPPPCPEAPPCPECKECPVVKPKKPLLKTEPTIGKQLDDIGRILNDR